MKLLNSVLLFAVAVFRTTDAFVGTRSFVSKAPRSSAIRSSSLQMVADDAKVVLVTGSSRGLGKAIALDLGKAGQKVIVNYVSPGSQEAAEQTVEEIKSMGGDAIAIQADCT